MVTGRSATIDSHTQEDYVDVLYRMTDREQNRVIATSGM
jgi:hypothetical protein